MVDLATARQLRLDRWRPALWNFQRVVSRYLMNTVLECWIGKAGEKGVAVGSDVGSRKSQHDFLRYERMDISAYVRLCHAVTDGGQAHDSANAGQGGMAAIEHAELGLLEGLHVSHNLDAYRRQHACVRRVGQVVLNNPLPEAFSAKSAPVGDT